MVKAKYVKENLRYMKEKGFGISQIRKIGIADKIQEIAKYNPEVFKKMFKEKKRLIDELRLSTFTDKEVISRILLAKKPELNRILENEKLMKEVGFNLKGTMGTELLLGPTEKIQELAELITPKKKKPKVKKKVPWWKRFIRK